MNLSRLVVLIWAFALVGIADFFYLPSTIIVLTLTKTGALNSAVTVSFCSEKTIRPKWREMWNSRKWPSLASKLETTHYKLDELAHLPNELWRYIVLQRPPPNSFPTFEGWSSNVRLAGEIGDNNLNSFNGRHKHNKFSRKFHLSSVWNHQFIVLIKVTTMNPTCFDTIPFRIHRICWDFLKR